MREPQKQDSAFLEKRRQLLKLGAAGMPMLLTMKASASSTLHSALDCAITIPDGLCILVDDEGAAWISTSYNHDGQKLTNGKVNQFKNSAQFVLPEGTIPERYRPEECSSNSNGNDCGWGNDIDDPTGDNDDQDSCPADPPRNTPWYEEDGQSGEPGNRGHGYGGNGNDSNHGGNGNGNGNGGGNDVECQYKIYCYDETQYVPGEFVNANGEWNLQGDVGLYTIAVAKYGEYYGAYDNFPGVSCLLSIMTYLNNR